MAASIADFSSNIWRPGSLKPDPGSVAPKIGQRGEMDFAQVRNITGETLAENKFLAVNESFSADFFDSASVSATEFASLGAPNGPNTAPPVFSPAADAVQRLTTLPDGKPNMQFFADKATELQNRVSRAAPTKGPLSPEALASLQQQNPVAYDRYMGLTQAQQQGVMTEHTGDDAIIFVPGNGWSSSVNDLKSPFLLDVPEGIREIFVASPGDSSVGDMLGIQQENGNWYLFGGLIDLGSPEMPGAGTASTWWVPDRILWADMSDYYSYHDEHYYGSDVVLSDIGKILSHEWNAFLQGASMDPLKMGLQIVYSAATTGVGLLTAAYNSAKGVLTSLAGGLGSLATGAGSLLGSLGGGAAGGGGCFGGGGGSPSSVISSILTGSGQQAGAPSAPGGGGGGGGPADGIVVTKGGGGGGGGAGGAAAVPTGRERAEAGKASEAAKADGGSGKANDDDEFGQSAAGQSSAGSKVNSTKSSNELSDMARDINPNGGTTNCRGNADAVIDRIKGTNPKATTAGTQPIGGLTAMKHAPNAATLANQNSSFKDAFDAVKKGGPGTTALVGIVRPNSPNHVIPLVNHNGTVAIVEGQSSSKGGAHAVFTPEQAQIEYNKNGNNSIDYEIVK